jgi:hypothetical protein
MKRTLVITATLLLALSAAANAALDIKMSPAPTATVVKAGSSAKTPATAILKPGDTAPIEVVVEAMLAAASAADENVGYRYDFSTGVLTPYLRFNGDEVKDAKDTFPDTRNPAGVVLTNTFRKNYLKKTEYRSRGLLAFLQAHVNPSAKADWSNW